MENSEILDSIAELKKGSRLSLGMLVLGVCFLTGTVYYSATRLRPLEEEIQAKREEIAQLEARKAELLHFAAAAENAARPAAPSTQESEGWIYLGRVSSSGAWAPQSDRVASQENPSLVGTGSRITTKEQASLVGSLDTPPDNASSANDIDSKTQYFVRPGTELKVLEVRDLPSVGSGKLLWAKVSVKSDYLLKLAQ